MCKFAFRGTAGDGRLGGHHPLLLVRYFDQRLYDFRCHKLLKSFGTEKSSARLSLMAFFNQPVAPRKAILHTNPDLTAQRAGVDYKYLQKLEGSKPSSPTLLTLNKLAKGLQITLVELVQSLQEDDG